jgi:hypothetical protein
MCLLQAILIIDGNVCYAYEIDTEMMSVTLIRKIDKNHVLRCLDIPQGVGTKMKVSPDITHIAIAW